MGWDIVQASATDWCYWKGRSEGYVMSRLQQRLTSTDGWVHTVDVPSSQEVGSPLSRLGSKRQRYPTVNLPNPCNRQEKTHQWMRVINKKQTSEGSNVQPYNISASFMINLNFGEMSLRWHWMDGLSANWLGSMVTLTSTETKTCASSCDSVPALMTSQQLEVYIIQSNRLKREVCADQLEHLKKQMGAYHIRTK
jgi:hypothetical protein